MAPTGKARLQTSRQTRWLAALGMLFVLGSFALLVRDTIVGDRPVANISVRVETILPSAQGYLVTLKIVNVGKATAAGLSIEGVLTRAGTRLETSQITVDYVAAGSERAAVLFFSNDPREGELTVRPKGYIEP